MGWKSRSAPQVHLFDVAVQWEQGSSILYVSKITNCRSAATTRAAPCTCQQSNRVNRTASESDLGPPGQRPKVSYTFPILPPRVVGHQPIFVRAPAICLIACDRAHEPRSSTASDGPEPMGIVKDDTNGDGGIVERLRELTGTGLSSRRQNTIEISPTDPEHGGDRDWVRSLPSPRTNLSAKRQRAGRGYGQSCETSDFIAAASG